MESNPLSLFNQKGRGVTASIKYGDDLLFGSFVIELGPEKYVADEIEYEPEKTSLEGSVREARILLQHDHPKQPIPRIGTLTVLPFVDGQFQVKRAIQRFANNNFTKILVVLQPTLV